MSLLINLGEDRAAVLINQINSWRPESRAISALESDICELFDLFEEMDQIDPKNRDFLEVVDLGEIKAPARFIRRVMELNKAGARIIACDHYGDCLIWMQPGANFENGHIDDISEELTAGAV